MTTTIARLDPCGPLKLRSRVGRVFRSKETAHNYANNLDRNVRIVILDGRWKVGQELRVDTPTRSLR